MSNTRKALNAAGSAFHRIAMAIQARELLARGVANDVLRKSVEEQQLADADIKSLCADQFEAIVRVLGTSEVES